MTRYHRIFLPNATSCDGFSVKRIKKLKRELNIHGLDAFLAIQNTRYLSSTTTGKAVIVPLDGDPVLICSRLEFEAASRESRIRDIRAYSSWRATLRRGERVSFLESWLLVAEVLKEFGTQAVGYDRAGKNLIRKIRNAHGASYKETPEIMKNLRMIKSPEELNLLRQSANIAVKGMNCANESIEPGRTELEIAAEVEYRMRKAGSEGTPFPTIVGSGKNSLLPHATATQKKLRKGELIVVDLGAIFDGYASDMTRTFSLAPTSKQSKLIQVVRNAQRAAMGKVRDGAKAVDVDTAGRAILTKSKLSKFATHGTGHGVGLEIHEPPNLAPNSRDILRKGMVITVEPGVYSPEVGGARWEDMLIVIKNGHQTLTL